MKLKKRLLTVFAAALLAFTFAPAAVLAVDETLSTQQTTSSPDALAALKARLEKRKAEFKTRLTFGQKTRLQARCKAAQGVIGTVKGRHATSETKHGEVYNNTATKLTDLSTKLQNRNVDTTQLDAAITMLKEKITTYTTDLTTYKEALSDLAAMDCSADADGFKASLEAARSALELVRKDTLDIRTHLKETIKPLLVTIRGQLGSTSTGGEG